MQNFVLTPIDPECLINSISERVTANLLKIVSEQKSTKVPDKLLSIQEASEFLKLTIPTIYTKVSKRELPVMKKGKRLYFSQDELMNFIKSGHVKVNDEIANEVESYLTQKK